MESPAFSPDSERSMVEFMNEHYAHSNLMYAKVYGQLWQATEARMVALDKEGMELDVTVPDGTRRIRIPFEHRLQDEGDAQQTLVEMSFSARDVLAQQARQRGVALPVPNWSVRGVGSPRPLYAPSPAGAAGPPLGSGPGESLR